MQIRMFESIRERLSPGSNAVIKIVFSLINVCNNFSTPAQDSAKDRFAISANKWEYIFRQRDISNEEKKEDREQKEQEELEERKEEEATEG